MRTRQSRLRILGPVAILVIGLGGIALADPVPVDTAVQVAVNHLNGAGLATLRTASVLEVFTETEGGTDLYYTVGFDPNGWAIISADDAAYPVIAYSPIGWYSEENPPPAFVAWMANVKSELAHAISVQMDPLPKAVEAWDRLDVSTEDFLAVNVGQYRRSRVRPLVKSTWGQGRTKGSKPWGIHTVFNSYNKYCPWEYTNERHTKRCYAPTGCVATAVAQIMKHHKWPPETSGDIEGYEVPYDCPEEDCEGYGRRNVDCSLENCSYNWSNWSMPLHRYADETARLMAHLGVALQMDYKCEGSGANSDDVVHALVQHFQYAADVSIRYRSDYPDSWTDDLRTELDAGRPLYYAGNPPEGGSGHAFVCDGYGKRSADHFHFNWGWDGFYNGYFLLEDLTPGSYDWTSDQEAVFNIRPPDWADVWVDDNYQRKQGRLERRDVLGGGR